MNWLNIHTDILRSEDYLGAEPLERATWLNLMGWCATQENGGIIEGAESWSDRKWQQLCGVTKEEVETTSDLFAFVGGNLVVSLYPIEKEAEVKSKRESGKLGGRPKKKKEPQPPKDKDKKPHGSENGNHEETTCPESAETEGKGREGKGSTCPLPDVLSKLWDSSPRKSRARSSKKEILTAWKSVRVVDRPDEATLLSAMEAWKKSEDWTKDNGQFVQGVHLWVRNRKWEALPETNRRSRKLSNEEGF